MLGQIYIPKGKALETAQQVLQKEKVYACNIAMGCSNCCAYCFGDTSQRRWDNSIGVRFPKERPIDLISKQLNKGLKPEGVFFSFMTDPFIIENKDNSNAAIAYLLEHKIPVATLSKFGAPYELAGKPRVGMTIVSDSDIFSKQFEKNALPISERIAMLKDLSEKGVYTWVSIEPYPTPSLFRQDFETLLNKIDFADFMIFGKWNYNQLANNVQFYKNMVADVRLFCKEKGIRHYIKSDTLKFVGEAKK